MVTAATRDLGGLEGEADDPRRLLAHGVTKARRPWTAVGAGACPFQCWLKPVLAFRLVALLALHRLRHATPAAWIPVVSFFRSRLGLVSGRWGGSRLHELFDLYERLVSDDVRHDAATRCPARSSRMAALSPSTESLRT